MSVRNEAVAAHDPFLLLPQSCPDIEANGCNRIIICRPLGWGMTSLLALLFVNTIVPDWNWAELTQRLGKLRGRIRIRIDPALADEMMSYPVNASGRRMGSHLVPFRKTKRVD